MQQQKETIRASIYPSGGDSPYEGSQWQMVSLYLEWDRVIIDPSSYNEDTMEYKWPLLGEQYHDGILDEVVGPESTKLNVLFSDPKKISHIFNALKGHQIHLQTEAYTVKLKTHEGSRRNIDTKLDLVPPARRLIDAEEFKGLCIAAAVMPEHRHT